MASVTLNDDGEFHRLLTNGRPRAAVLTLNDDGEFNRLLTNGFTFRTQHVQVAPVDRRATTSVHVFIDAEVEDEDLQRRLESFGTVVGPVVHKYDSYKGHRIDAGIRYLNMILKEVVPNFVEVKMSSGGKATRRLWHNGQVKTCRVCNRFLKERREREEEEKRKRRKWQERGSNGGSA